MTIVPAIVANCSANSDTPPVPCTTTGSPGLTWPSVTTARQAVTRRRSASPLRHAPSLRRAGEMRGRTRRFLAGEAVGGTGRIVEVGTVHMAIALLRMESGNHRVANREFLHAFSNGDDFACAVRQRDHLFLHDERVEVFRYVGDAAIAHAKDEEIGVLVKLPLISTPWL